MYDNHNILTFIPVIFQVWNLSHIWYKDSNWYGWRVGSL